MSWFAIGGAVLWSVLVSHLSNTYIQSYTTMTIYWTYKECIYMGVRVDVSLGDCCDKGCVIYRTQSLHHQHVSK